MARGFLSEDDGRDREAAFQASVDMRRHIEIAGKAGAAARGGFFFYAGTRSVFVPFRNLISSERDAKTDITTITVPEWWARKEGLL